MEGNDGVERGDGLPPPVRHRGSAQVHKAEAVVPFQLVAEVPQVGHVVDPQAQHHHKQA